jgi:Tol biopolymer transport system component
VDDAEFERLSAKILDGEVPDWEALERATPPEQRARLDALRAISQVAAASHTALGERQRERWAGFDLIEPVGHGGYGDVWRAHDPQLDREIALKLIPAEDEDVDDVLREGRLLARIRHPNVATIYGATHVDGEIGVAMEFIGGDDLDTIVRRDGPLPARDVIDIGLQLARALDAVHRAGVLHRDIKASNVKRTEEDRVILLDFGSSRELRLHTIEPADEAGTPLYVAPEVFAGGTASVQSDLYSLGVLLHFLATGRYPVTASSFADLAAKHAARRSTATSIDATLRLSRRLTAVLTPLLAPDAQARPRSAAEVARRLARRRSRYAIAAGTAAILIAGGSAFSARFLARTSGFGREPAFSVRRLDFAIAPATVGRPSRDGRVLPFVDRRNGGLALMHTDTGSIDLLTYQGDMLHHYVGASVASPDGREIAYEWQGNGKEQLQVLDVASRSSRVVWQPGRGEIQPTAWSPGDRMIAGVLTDGDRRDLFVLPADGGQPRVFAVGGVDAPSFSENGRYLIFQNTGDNGSTLWKVAVDRGDPEPIDIVAGDDQTPLWSDGRLVFVSNRGGESSVWSVPMNTDGKPAGAPAEVPGTNGIVELLGVLPDGSLLARRGEGTSQVLSANLDGSAVHEISTGPGTHLSPDWSPDGTLVAYITEPPGPFRRVLRIRNVVTGEERSLRDLGRNSGAPGHIGLNPRFSPDGRRILVRTLPNVPKNGFIVVDLKTTAESGPYLTHRSYRDVEWDDDTHVVFGESERGISRLDLETGHEELLSKVPPNLYVGRGVALTPDRTRIAFVLETEASATSHMMVMNRDGSDVHELFAKSRPRPYGGLPQFSAVPLLLGQWTAEGRELLFASTDVLPNGYTKWDTRLWAVAAEGGAPRATGLVIAGLRDIRVNRADGRLAFSMFTVQTEAVVLPGVLRQPEAVR